MSKLREILDRYKKLCDFCEGFWDRVCRRYPGAIACAPGCSTCCELPSVNHLEAHIITIWLQSKKTKHTKSTEKVPCPFLENDRCSIYESRPIICRTHGLLLKSEEYAYALTVSCPFNFADVDLDSVDPAFVLEIDRVSDNLARLNAAFCLLKGDVQKAGDRILLRDLAGGKS